MMKEEIRHADNEKIDLRVWKRLVAYGLKYKARVIRTILVLLLVSGADLAYPLLTRYAINHFIVGGTTEGLGLFGLINILVVIAQGIGVVLFVRGAGRLEMDMSYDIRQNAFSHLQQLSFSYYDTTSVGWLMARMGSDVSRLSEMIAWSIVDVMCDRGAAGDELEAGASGTGYHAGAGGAVPLFPAAHPAPAAHCAQGEQPYYRRLQRGRYGRGDQQDPGPGGRGPGGI